MKSFRKLALTLLVIAAIAGMSAVQVSADTPYVGEIRIFPYDFAPVGWYECDGTVLPISENDTLFALIGTTYGGDGQETFALPDLRGLEPYPGIKFCISLYGIYPSQT